MTTQIQRDWRATFNATFGVPPSRVVASIWRSVLGEDYPESLDPHSFVTWTELERAARELQVGPGSTLVDVGCGRGGPGLWLAATTGSSLVGIDIADAAVSAARERAAALGLEASFRQGTFEATGLPDQSVDGLVSFDALLFTPSKAMALVELHRTLRIGGRLVFTTWDYHRQPEGRPPQVGDHRPLLGDAGFDVLAYDETPRWRENETELYRLMLDSAEALAAEDGVSLDEERREIELEAATGEAMSRRVFVVAEAR